jgi:hypothetical protein
MPHGEAVVTAARRTLSHRAHVAPPAWPSRRTICRGWCVSGGGGGARGDAPCTRQPRHLKVAACGQSAGRRIPTCAGARGRAAPPRRPRRRDHLGRVRGRPGSRPSRLLPLHLLTCARPRATSAANDSASAIDRLPATRRNDTCAGKMRRPTSCDTPPPPPFLPRTRRTRACRRRTCTRWCWWAA